MYPIVKISAAFLDASVKSQYLIQGYYARYPSYNDNNIAEFGSSPSRVNDHKKRWSLAAKPAGERGNQCLFLNTAYARNKNISLIRNPDFPQSVTPDSDHQPDYNDILSQRIQSSQRALGLEVNLAEETPVDVTSSMSMGWNFPLYEQVTTGPVAALHYDGTTTSMYNEFGDSTTTLTDPLWHASVSTLGWRVDSRRRSPTTGANQL